ncbi:rho GTPase-activating protein 7 isoform 2-T2 [Pholidichthys leucotaenia]
MLITKIEAKEACDWLRAAGFPQYVQLFKDGRFPIDIEWAKHDHHFLDIDALDSLYRRLITLNKCVEMRLELRRSKGRRDDCNEEDFCAISPNWTYDRQTKQWRRLDSPLGILGFANSPMCDVGDHHDGCSIHSSSSTESEGHAGHHSSLTRPAADDRGTSRSSSRCSSTTKTPSLDTSFSGPPSPGGNGGGLLEMSLEHDGCHRDKRARKKCTTLLRKMEKLKLRGTSGLRPLDHSRSRMGRVISGPVLVQDERMDEPHCSSSLQGGFISQASSSPSPAISTSSSNSQSESSSTVSTPSPVTRVRSNCKRSNSSASVGGRMTQNNQNQKETEDCKNQINNDNNRSHQSVVFQIPHGHKPGTFPISLAHKHPLLSPIIDDTSVNWRTGSFHGYRAAHSASSLATGDQGAVAPQSSSSDAPNPLALADHRQSIYDNVPDSQQLYESEGGSTGSGSDAERTGEESEVSQLLQGEDIFAALDSILKRIGDLQQLVSSWSENLSEDDSRRAATSSSHTSSSSASSGVSPCPSSPSHIHLEVQNPEEEEEEQHEKLPVSIEEPNNTTPLTMNRSSRRLHPSSEQNLPSGPGLEYQSASQLLLLQKLSLLKLTTLMDKYSPSSKQGWNWTVPRPLRKHKVLEVKGQRVFGVPLLIGVQQTGEPLPASILGALVYLRTECLDQVGLFRKSGVKSRIQYLRELVESNPEGVSYDGQSAFDVADMVKQYFRDLPEPIFTSKLCESFLHIYQYFPKDQQLVAAQAAILLLPDENREALRTLLFFLRDVVDCMDENQMTPTNLAVCLAPSLFHLNTLKRDANAARSNHRKYSLGVPHQRDLSENLAATQGLANMITEAEKLFQFPEFWSLSEESGDGLVSLSQSGAEEELEDQRKKLELNTQHLFKEAKERSRGWESYPAPEHVELAFKKMDDGCPLWTWRGSVEVDATQVDILHRLLREQQLWEQCLHHTTIIQSLPKDAEVYHYVLQGRGHTLGSQPPWEFLLLRIWQADPSSGPLYLSSVSIDHPEVPAEGVRTHIHSCLYLLEPMGARKTRLIHLCRTETRGRSHEWHNNVNGHHLASGLLAIRNSFRADHKEPKI